MTGGTASTVSRRLTPASQSRPIATQNSRMALPAAAFALRLLAHGVDRAARPASSRVILPRDRCVQIAADRSSEIKALDAPVMQSFPRPLTARPFHPISVCGLFGAISANGHTAPASGARSGPVEEEKRTRITLARF